MGFYPRRLVSGAQLTNSPATYYTATNVKARIDAATIRNDNSTAETFSIWLVPTGGSADDTNQVIKDRSIAAGQSQIVPEIVGHYLEAGGTIQAVASNGSQVNLIVSGGEIT
ncbi:hypothetical protein L2U69_11810 [Zavarzinia compransoris]|uniref:hypothetical protein n=1 Tax=Zavarzinia marina TaxID=2911065 RepID=UPI001F19785A|nr:hypothetical protein [Zavarzinia marina]MCF4166332.1 hypothetical protein [Zavarzinia marina]